MSLKTIRTLFSASAALLLIIGCGSEESKQQPPKAAEQPAPEAAPKGAQENKIVEQVDEDGKGMHITATKPNGTTFQASIGEEVAVPDEFPKDVPVFPGSTPMASLYSPDEGVLVTFKSTEDQQAIHDFYQTSPGGNQLSLEAHKQDRTISITIGGRTGDSRVSVIVTTEK